MSFFGTKDEEVKKVVVAKEELSDEILESIFAEMKELKIIVECNRKIIELTQELVQELRQEIKELKSKN